MTIRHPLVDQVKTQLLPLPRWEAALERVIERLPRRLIPVEFDKIHDIAILDQQQGKYQALGIAPCFTLSLAPFSSGSWYYLEGALVRNNGSREATLVVKTDDEKLHSVLIPTNLRGTVREVFFLPVNAVSLQWFPTAAQGYFSQSSLLIHRITLLESILRRFYRVAFDLWRMRGRMDKAAQWPALWQACFRLHDSYLKTAKHRSKRLCGNDYPTFIALNDTLTKRDRAAICQQLAQWPTQPRISLIMALHDPNLAWLCQTVEDCIVQLNPNWELVVAGDFTTNDYLHLFLAPDRKGAGSITTVHIPAVTDTAMALNAALAAATGDFVVRLGQHDRMPPQSLFFYANEIRANPDCALVYGDDDDLDNQGQRTNPRFKPDWNPDLLTSCHYLGRSCLYRRDRVVAIGGYRSGLGGAMDYDLCLRYVHGLPGSAFRHVPRIVAHRRGVALESVRETPDHEAGKKALEDYFANGGAIVEDGPAPMHYRIRHPLPNPSPLVSIIIPSRDQGNVLAACVDSIISKTTYRTWEILIVDNRTTEAAALSYLEKIGQHPNIRVLRHDAPFNYATINNEAVKEAKGEVLALLNNDIEVITPNWLEEMVSHALRPDIGAVGAKLLYANNTIQHAGVILGLGGIAGHGHKYLPDGAPGYCHRAVVTQNVSAVTGACLVVHKSIYTDAGGLDEEFAVAYNDIDFCLRLLEQGYRNIFTPYAKLYHHESLTRGPDNTPEKQTIFLRETSLMRRKWGALLDRDRAYNPNLSLDFEGYTLKIR